MAIKDRAPAGRPPITSAAQIASVGLDLFTRQGYDATTLTHVAEQAGIGRSTLFRYFDSKSAIVWHGQDEAEAALLAALRDAPAGPCWRIDLGRCLMTALRFPGDDVGALRLRMRLIDTTPSLRAHLHSASGPGTAAIADLIARSTGTSADDLEPVVVARAAWWSVVDALIWWAHDDTGAPEEAVRRGLGALGLDPGPTPA